MALKPCDECKKEVSTEAVSCPHCGKADPTGEIAVKKTEQQKKANYGCLSVVSVLVGMFGLLVVMCNKGMKSSGGESNEAHDRRIWAIVDCHEAAKARMLTPSKTEFPRDGEHVAQMDDSTLAIAGYIDSENEYGAMLRGSYTCLLQGRGDHLPITHLEVRDPAHTR